MTRSLSEVLAKISENSCVLDPKIQEIEAIVESIRSTGVHISESKRCLALGTDNASKVSSGDL